MPYRMLELSHFLGPRAPYGVFGVSTDQGAVAGEWSMLAISAPTQKPAYIISYFYHTTSATAYLGKSAIDPLNGAAKTALGGTGSMFGTVRAATPFEGTSLTDRASQGWRVAQNTARVTTLPYPLVINPGEWFFLQSVANTVAMNATVTWLEATQLP